MSSYIVDPIQVRMHESDKGLIYKSIVALGFRARQINDDIRNEINVRMADVIDANDNTEGANFDQIAISREFDKMPKPTFIAMKEIMEGKLSYDLPDPESGKKEE